MTDHLARVIEILSTARSAALSSGLPVMEVLDDGTVVERLGDGSVWFVKKIEPCNKPEHQRYEL